MRMVDSAFVFAISGHFRGDALLPTDIKIQTDRGWIIVTTISDQYRYPTLSLTGWMNVSVP